MSRDDIDISHSYNAVQSATGVQRRSVDAARTDDNLYAFEDCPVVRLPSGGALLVNRHSARQMGVTNDVAVALEHCKHFRTLRGHAEFLTGYMPELGGDVAGVLRVLEQMRDARVLTGAGEMVAQFDSTLPEESALAPSRAFIITCDRPEALQRLLDTLPADVDLSLHERFYVVDDSRRVDNAVKNRALVEAFNRHNAASMMYFGLEERHSLLQGLIEGLPQYADEIRFLLDQQRWYNLKTYSIPRSLCQLLSVGRRAVMIDDDVLCRSYEPPEAESGVAFVESVGEAIFYPSDEAWKTANRRRGEDPLAGHLKCLGRDVQSTLRELDAGPLGPEMLAGSEANQLRGLDDSTRVLLTQCGTYGDPGTGDMSWVLLLKGKSLERLLTRPEGVQSALRNRTCWLGRSKATLARHGNMSGITGLDNTTLLPPYIPAGRGGDAFLAYMVEFLYPRSLALDYTWAVPHLPIDERVGTFEWHGDIGDPTMLWSYIRDNVTTDATASLENRLASLVHLIRDLGARSDASLAAAYRTELAAQQAASARQIMDQLRAMPVDNPEWRQLLELRRHKIFRALGRHEVPVTARGYEELSEAGLLANVRRLATTYANALEAWPQIRHLARAIVG